jgi:ferritin-like metal-binding protein YciE
MTLVSADQARDLFIVGARDAHAMEMQAKALIERQLGRLEHYPTVEARLRQHHGETERQIARAEEVLSSLGQDSSALKDVSMKLSGNVMAMFHAMAGDEILKNSFANFAFENYEIAAYDSLITMGEAAKLTSSARLLGQSLQEERNMAQWLADNLRDVTMTYLKLRTEHAEAHR